jgi:polysaccharide export outer membrane protein
MGQAGNIGDLPDSPSSALPPPSVASSAMALPKVGQGGLTIQPDSLVRISVAEDPGLDGSYPVNEIGAVQLGYIGPVILSNHTEKEAEEKIASILKSRDFRNATVGVRILRASYDKVRVAGAVNTPGLIRIGSGDRITLNDALLQAGGLKASAKDVKVRIVRGGLMTAVAFDLPGEEYDLVDADGNPNVPRIALKNNDLVYVYGMVEKKPGEGPAEAAGISERRITLLGEVTRQGVYVFSSWEPCTMMHLMFKINGLPPYANRRAIKVVRSDESGREQDFEVNVDKILEDGDPNRDFVLEDGDRVIVPARRISLF